MQLTANLVQLLKFTEDLLQYSEAYVELPFEEHRAFMCNSK